MSVLYSGKYAGYKAACIVWVYTSLKKKDGSLKKDLEAHKIGY